MSIEAVSNEIAKWIMSADTTTQVKLLAVLGLYYLAINLIKASTSILMTMAYLIGALKWLIDVVKIIKRRKNVTQ